MILPDDKLSQRQVRSALYLKTTGEQAAIGSKLERLFIPDTTLADQQLIDTFLPHILENEAKGVLQDMLAQHALAMQPLFFSEEATRKAIKHVVVILTIAIGLGWAGQLKAAISHKDGCLYGYALLFVHPNPSVPRYCHKIFVFPDYRGHNIGSQILNALI
ncbi:hypothetical protein Pfra02_24000 [Pseudomonas fragi]|nr:hypothetical protein Pfra02_24000 [Pseudomonas fragi]